MPAPKKRYYSAADIQVMLGISKSKAIQYMHMFQERGQLLRDGKLMRIRVDVFEDWLREKDGAMSCEQRSRTG